MFKVRKVCLISSFTVLALLASVTLSSFAFEYDGGHWDDADLPVGWWMNQNGTPDCTGEFGAVQAAYQTWENVSGSYFSETYMGTTTRGLGYDGYNVVSWGDSEGAFTVAICWTWYQPSTLRTLECDIEFQNNHTWSSTGEAGKYDVQNIGIHEFGHTLRLKDLYGSGDTQKTMYGYVSLGETKKRTLHQDDIDGIRHIYPTSGIPVLEVDPPYLAFGPVEKGLSKIMTFQAYNTGGGILTGTITANRDWITVSHTSLAGDVTVSVTVDTSELPESLTPQPGTVTVISNGGTKTVEVSVTVIPTGGKACPNPVSFKDNNLTLWGSLIPYGEVRIYNLAGELVITLFEIDGANTLSWNGKNEKGAEVADGIYLYIGEGFRGKFAVK